MLMSSFKIIELSVLEKKTFKGFYHMGVAAIFKHYMFLFNFDYTESSKNL